MMLINNIFEIRSNGRDSKTYSFSFFMFCVLMSLYSQPLSTYSITLPSTLFFSLSVCVCMYLGMSPHVSLSHSLQLSIYFPSFTVSAISHTASAYSYTEIVLSKASIISVFSSKCYPVTRAWSTSQSWTTKR